MLHDVIRYLRLLQNSSGLDVGCGIGLPAMILAGVMGEDIRVTGIDTSETFIQTARRLSEKAGFSNQLRFETGSASALPYGDALFDWAMSIDCVNYAPTDALPLLKEMKRVVKPGGKIVLLGWTSQQLLPGHPELEAKLNATPEGIAPFKAGMNPERHFLRTASLFETLGLKNRKAHTFIGNVCAPLTPDIYDALKDLLSMRWAERPSGLSGDEVALYKGLTHPDSPGFILNNHGYHGFFTCTLFSAMV
ncbi:hypothetical protein DSLASN_18360 [Desulfoluna limicola]|uniref:Methyltransferase type 11 domain-containing protein n=2 Tax=Desulfoluna limicola TaxID=2810562 RepID=A0ABM7PG42_9BACT|nr:hypothetical protein DSLASN_18360 [Desulfoluna limicola]